MYAFWLQCEDCEDVATIVLRKACAHSQAETHHEEAGHRVEVGRVLDDTERVIGTSD